MKLKKIKIELELNPEMALLMVLYLHSATQDDNKLRDMLTVIGKNQIFLIAQNIMDQLSEKLDPEFLKMCNSQNYLANLKDNSFLEDLGNYLN